MTGRPLIGTPESQAFSCFKWSRNTWSMLGPAMAQELYNHIENQKILDPVIELAI
jgi:hypothetical protein